MKNCLYCNKGFEPWEYEYECDDCDEYGLEERWYDWSFGEPDMRTCSHCHGDKIIKDMESQFCCDDCREEYFQRKFNF